MKPDVAVVGREEGRKIVWDWAEDKPLLKRVRKAMLRCDSIAIARERSLKMVAKNCKRGLQPLVAANNLMAAIFTL